MLDSRPDIDCKSVAVVWSLVDRKPVIVVNSVPSVDCETGIDGESLVGCVTVVDVRLLVACKPLLLPEIDSVICDEPLVG